MAWKPGARHAARRRSGPVLWQDLAQVVNTIAPLQHINHILGKPRMANRAGAVEPGAPAGPDRLTQSPLRAAGTLVPTPGAGDSTRHVHFRVTLAASSPRNVLPVGIPEETRCEVRSRGQVVLSAPGSFRSSSSPGT